MAGKDLILDFSEYDLDHVIADADEIRRYNPQRFEMEQLTAVVYEDAENIIAVGYNDLAHDAFWVRGHMPGMPLMPGVLICESAAQLSSYMVVKYDLLGSRLIGFGGLSEVRFRGIVRPGDRLVIVTRMTKVRRGAIIVSKFQTFVEQNLVCEGIVKGIPLPEDALAAT